MRGLHETVAWVLIGVNAVAGVWCLAAYRWAALRSTLMWGTVFAAEAVVFVQALVGAVLSRRAGTQLGDMHALYGFSAIVAVMIVQGYRTSPFMKGKQLVLFGCGSLFVMGLGLRNLVLH